MKLAASVVAALLLCAAAGPAGASSDAAGQLTWAAHTTLVREVPQRRSCHRRGREV
jgi:hypothetical protein